LTKKAIIDVVSDVVCPWCYLGKRRLEAAAALRPDINIEVRWRPYFLNPQVPREGMSRIDYLSRKFGSDERFRPAHERISKLGKEEGVEFHFERIARQPNTLDVHRVIGWAAAAGKASSMVEMFFALFFTQGANLTDREVLITAAAAVGLDPDEVRRDLAGDRDIAAIENAANTAAEGGVSGVPFFIFNNRLAAAGAQTPDVLAAAIDQALAAEEAA
jgi:predicted DsbA family dithiol-disulfide isomerase